MVCTPVHFMPAVFMSGRYRTTAGGSITVDRDTKIRQYLFLLLTMVSLVFTVMLYFESDDWLIPAMASYLAMGVVLYRGTKHVRFVPCEQDKNGAE